MMDNKTSLIICVIAMIICYGVGFDIGGFVCSMGVLLNTICICLKELGED